VRCFMRDDPMKTLEFESPLNADQRLNLPAAVAEQVSPGRTASVHLMVADSEEEKDWHQLTATEFFKGCAQGDAIYDELPSD
jgi:hypothetical protein